MKWFKFDINSFTDEEYNKWYSFMSEEKQKRVDKFRFVEDKKRSVAGDMLVRKAISDCLCVSAESINFSISEKGKPYIPDFDIEFNISHSGDMVVCAVDNTPVGIDIEKIRPLDLKISKKVFSDDELIYLFDHVPTHEDFIFTENEEILKRFFRLWTKKEAYGKFIGCGIFTDETNKDCKFEYIEEINDYIICICSQK